MDVRHSPIIAQLLAANANRGVSLAPMLPAYSDKRLETQMIGAPNNSAGAQRFGEAPLTGRVCLVTGANQANESLIYALAELTLEVANRTNAVIDELLAQLDLAAPLANALCHLDPGARVAHARPGVSFERRSVDSDVSG